MHKEPTNSLEKTSTLFQKNNLNNQRGKIFNTR